MQHPRIGSKSRQKSYGVLYPFCMFKILLWLSLFSSLACDDSLQELEINGFTVIHGLFSEEELLHLSDQFQEVKDKAFHIINTVPAKPRHFRENETQNRSIYWKTDRELILQAGRGRYDFFQGFQIAPLHYPALEELMQCLMIEEFTNYAGWIYSEPGSGDQYWHRDTHPLTNFGTDGSKLILMDDFYFTVLIPITVPFTFENGATEFVVGSHKLAAASFDQCRHVQVEVPLGSALVFNGKINHRGKANTSNEARPALYLVYHKKWYDDQYRYGISADTNSKFKQRENY